jgi:hypothetical protein
MRRELLVFYCPGSRGDFLAAILLDQIKHCYQQYAITQDLHYHKMHGLGDVNPHNPKLNATSILKHREHSIKIKLAPGDYSTVSRLATAKGLEYFESVADVENWEKQYRMLDIRFKHVVWFSSLFDVGFLQDFYQRFNGRAMPDYYVPMIKHNIELQLNYKPEHHTTVQSDLHLIGY